MRIILIRFTISIKLILESVKKFFFNRPLYVEFDAKNSLKEPRWIGLGRTKSSRRLFISFTVRDKSVRVISSRDMNKKEKRKYEQKIKKYSGF